MDPGDLFEPVARFFEPGEPERARSQRPAVGLEHRGAALPATPSVAAIAVIPALAGLRAEDGPAPWTAYEARRPSHPPVALLEAPRRDPQPVAPPSLPPPSLEPLVIAPRVSQTQPFIADPGEVVSVPSSRTGPRVSIGRVEIEVVPSPSHAPPQPSAPSPSANGTIDIESISQIGPLARHFPNRRRLRLRYR